MTTTQKETMGFKTEVKQLLHLMIHSLYSNKEIFLRELVSNASDACDKLRFEAISNADLYEGNSELSVHIDFDAENKTVTIEDNGIGMTRDDVVNHLGTIAKSGTSEFLGKLSGDEKQDSQLIGQFGVGFYASFIVAQDVVVETRRAGLPADQAVRWQSQGEGEFSLENIEKSERGTRITLHLKDEETEFADGIRLRSLIKKYSDHISVPIFLPQESVGEESEGEGKAEPEAVNDAKALWTKSKTDISDEEYKEFYKHISHDWQEPLAWSHNKVEGKLDYTSLLYIPSQAPMDLWNRDAARGLKLYTQRVYIMDEAEQFLPLYLRFVKGVLDSNDLSLNVSREILQQDKNVDSIRAALTKRVLDMLTKMAKKDAEQYGKFWAQFGEVLKEGPAEDFSNKEKIANLFRFASTQGESDSVSVSLADYVSRMKENQKKIYYVTGENYDAVYNSPHIEFFKKNNIEVLLLTQRVDEWMISHLGTFDEKSFQDITKGELDLDELTSDEEKAASENLAEENKSLVERIKTALEGEVSQVRVTSRLTDSPACLVVGQNDMNDNLRQMLAAAGQEVPPAESTLEVNPNHPLISTMDKEQDESRFSDLAHVIYGQAQLAQGSQLKKPADYVSKLNNLLHDLLK